jgi:predicted Zn-dependent protease
MLTSLEIVFDRLANALTDTLAAVPDPKPHFTLTLRGEHTQFVRFNHAKVRQTGTVQDARLALTLMQDDRSSTCELGCTGDWETDWAGLQSALADLRHELPQLPVDPYFVLPSGEQHSREVTLGTLLAPNAVAETVLSPVIGLDFAGIYAAGDLFRAYADSAGQRHWFSTQSFDLDYSLFTADGQAVKATLAGSHWQDDRYHAQLATCKTQLGQLSQPAKAIPRGHYRTYLAPAAVAELVSMLNWGGASEAAIQQGSSCLGMLQRQEKFLSQRFTLRENFQHGLIPRFNEWGDIAPMDLPVITAGNLTNTLVSRRSAKEYGKPANGATSGEGLRSPYLSPGTLPPDQILTQLGTGLYVSNLHYLNWSDRPAGRITGMTRYACFWVEQGEIIAPIENLRFDESLYRYFGDTLLDLTTTVEFVPEISTYDYRSIGGSWVPGILVDNFTYTL